MCVCVCERERGEGHKKLYVLTEFGSLNLEMLLKIEQNNRGTVKECNSVAFLRGTTAHREWIRWRLKGCWDQGTPQLGSEGTGSLESATRATTDHALTRSGRSTVAAAAAFLEHRSAIVPAPDRLHDYIDES